MNEWECPLCHRKGWWVRSAKDAYWADHGGGMSVCRDCEKNRSQEIEERRRLFYGAKTDKKDPNCKHKWEHPYPGRFYCMECGATYNFTCMCGGSMYVCPKHYDEFIDESAPLEEFLNENSW